MAAVHISDYSLVIRYQKAVADSVEITAVNVVVVAVDRHQVWPIISCRSFKEKCRAGARRSQGIYRF